LPQITCPTLIVWGDKDRTTPLTIAYRFQKGIVNSKLYIIKGAGHNAHQTHTKEWSQIVTNFIKN
jgi:pimeloyl-ACP methyl ester carboxylesterase